MNLADYKKLARKPNKYRAVRTTVDGITFHSKLEAARYSELKLLERAGKVHDLVLQPVYPIVLNGIRICKTIGDFSYFEVKTGKFVTEDVKGMDTPTSRIKRRL